MKPCLAKLCLLGSVLHVLTTWTVRASEFHLEGDYMIGGLFDIHRANDLEFHDKPEAIDCSRQSFYLPGYRRLQLMRFAIEEINNSTNLLPNISLGYKVFDHCSERQNFPEILNLLSVNGLIQLWSELQKQQTHGSHGSVPKVMAVVGPLTSTQSLTVAPFFMANLIPMVNYGSSSSVFSDKRKFPAFLRTVHSSKDDIEAMVNIMEHFHWHWIAFLYNDNDFGNDGLEILSERIKDTEICLAYTKGLSGYVDYPEIFQQIEAQTIKVIIVFSTESTAHSLIKSAIKLNISDKVWIAGQSWSLSKIIPNEKGIKNIGTILGIAESAVAIPGFNNFIYASKSHNYSEKAGPSFCNQACNCSGLSPQDVVAANPYFSFPVYSAVYAIAHALHNALECGSAGCNDNNTVHPQMVLAELEKSNFTLLNQRVHFDKNGDPKFGFYIIVFWNHRGDPEEVGFLKLYPSVTFVMNNSKIQWHTRGEVPTSLCSPECPVGHAKNQNGINKCCFICEICPTGTFLNSTDDPYTCLPCKETEWSAEGSTSCSLREVEYIPFTDTGAILIMVGAVVFVALTLAMSVLFAINYNTPVVRSAGGPMCFLILGCLSLSSLSVFFYFDKPIVPFCILRFLPFLLFYTVCLACFAVRSFQIVCIFKIAAKFPKLHRCWMKYQGQWLVITGVSVIQALLLIFSYSYDSPKLYNETLWYPDKIILSCDINLEVVSGSVVVLLSLCFFSFIFSYMGKDLPKNYNEAKSITFCLMLLIITWIIFTTVCMLYRGKYIQILNALAVLSSLYSFLFWYFFAKCYIILLQPQKNTQKYFQGLIQNYTKTISQ